MNTHWPLMTIGTEAPPYVGLGLRELQSASATNEKDQAQINLAKY